MPKYTPFLLLSLLGLGQAVFAQNLVTNPGFEQKYKCPTGRSEIIVLPLYDGFPTVLDWVSAVNTTPDYFNTCGTTPDVQLPNLSLDGYHEPRSGNACAGISMISCHPYADTSDYWSEYLETKLSSPLQAGHTYYICYYVCLTYHARNAYNIISVDNIGARLTTQMIDTTCAGPMYFVTGPPDIHTPAGYYITDTANWTLVSGIYHATGGEQWLTIGRFYTSEVNFQFLLSPQPGLTQQNSLTNLSSVCYMLVDDVCAIDMAHPDITDTLVYTPQFPISIGLGKAEGQYQYLWDNGDTAEQILVDAAGKYARQRWGDCGYYIDTFTVAEVPVDYCVLLPNAFTPNGDGRNDLFGPGDTYCQPDFSDFNFSVYNRWGQLMFQTTQPGAKWDGRYNGAAMEVGTYFYTLTYRYSSASAAGGKAINNGQPQLNFIKGDVTLIR